MRMYCFSILPHRTTANRQWAREANLLGAEKSNDLADSGASLTRGKEKIPSACLCTSKVSNPRQSTPLQAHFDSLLVASCSPSLATSPSGTNKASSSSVEAKV